MNEIRRRVSTCQYWTLKRLEWLWHADRDTDRQTDRQTDR